MGKAQDDISDGDAYSADMESALLRILGIRAGSYICGARAYDSIACGLFGEKPRGFVKQKMRYSNEEI